MLLTCEARGCAGAGGDQRLLHAWSLLGDQHGPLWDRAQAQAPEAAVCSGVAVVLRSLGAARMVVGHTPQQSGRAAARCGGRLLLLDTGMSAGMLGSPAAAWACWARDSNASDAGAPPVTGEDGLLDLSYSISGMMYADGRQQML